MESGSVGAEIIPACRGVDWQLYLPPLLLFVVAWLTGKDWRGSAWRSVTLPLALMALLALIVWPYVAEIRSLADRPDSIGTRPPTERGG